MSPPSIYGEPKITHDEQSGSVFLECVVTNAEPPKTKWFLNDTEISSTATYKFSNDSLEGNRKKFVCEIKKFNKSLAGVYKAVFTSSDEKENHATFTVQSGNAPEFYEKPKIAQKEKDGQGVIEIRVRAKSHIEMKAEWQKDGKPIKSTDRIKISSKQDEKDKDGTQFVLEIIGPQKDDQAKYSCLVKNAEGQNVQSLNLVFD